MVIYLKRFHEPSTRACWDYWKTYMYQEMEKFKNIKNLTFELHILDVCISCSHEHNFKLSLFHFEQWLDIQ